MGKRLIIGLTGPMCAGKNLAGDILLEMGCAVIDADQCVHKAIELAKDTIIASFTREAEQRGLSLLKDNGTLDRRVLGIVVFSDPRLLSIQEHIVHPIVNSMLNQFIDEHPKQSVVLNATVLYKAQVISRCDFLIYVDSFIFLRFFRALKRDGFYPMQIIKRFSMQKHLFTQHQKKNVDIYRVRNGGRAAILKKRLEIILYTKGY